MILKHQNLLQNSQTAPDRTRRRFGNLANRVLEPSPRRPDWPADLLPSAMRPSPAHRSLILLLAALGLALWLLLPGRQTRAVPSPPVPGVWSVERSGKEPGLNLKIEWPADFPRTLQDLGFYAGVQTGAVWTALVLITVYLLFHQRSQP